MGRGLGAGIEVATRFYIGNNTAPAITPAFSTSWDKINGVGVGRRGMNTSTGSAGVTISCAAGGVTNQNILFRQWISDPLQLGGVIDGTVRGQIRALESGAADRDYCPQFVARVFSGDGLTERGILLDVDNSALSNEFSAAALTNAKFPRNWSGSGTPITSMSAQAGDVVVVELGFRTFSTFISNGNINANDNQASDLPEDETTTTVLRSWLEFSAEIFNLFQANPTPAGHPAGAGVGLAVSKRWQRRRRTWMPRG